MITIEKVKADIGAAKIRLTTEIPDEKKGLIRKEIKHIEFLETCKAYLENNPKQQYLESEKTRLEALLKKISEGFNSWRHDTIRAAKTLEELKSEYAKLMDTKKHKTHLKTVTYLLGDTNS